ncbi:dTDP-glucose 4,6-dehydratase [Noviherbaspirillum aridicola]|uniref:dTDP-glucose 4,6-dehydratase n=1 Tax=Noviherbaspirillum aridicola TaxID=2849687 RepID=A0ABQ4Q475_9BURK|nr:dTDP-glucose 4,6-dehydratase [Noviherbaspirillum aridicola]GIZ51620.1 dTDP-glucose 4,6-dehydratase [Noviherbaspirillum aridicola]
MIVVTGGAGFIGSNFILDWLARSREPVLNLDALTYAANPANLRAIANDARHVFVRADIRDRDAVSALLAAHRPRAVLNFAAESHVDRSIHGPAEFVSANLDGVFSLLEAARAYWEGLPAAERDAFRLLQVSTDEVYGSLRADDPPFTETTPYAPNSPYSASKAGADHLVRAWCHTYGLPTLTTNCSNNYGPHQFPEKLVPLTIVSALAGRPLPIYGDGSNVRDWLFVEDHCAALRRVLEAGRPGETYNIGGGGERSNLQVVRMLCRLLDELSPRADGRSYAAQIRFVADRPGHDARYAINADKLRQELGWQPAHGFEEGMRRTVAWYLANREWVEQVQTGAYRAWMETHYARRATQEEMA